MQTLPENIALYISPDRAPTASGPLITNAPIDYCGAMGAPSEIHQSTTTGMREKYNIYVKFEFRKNLWLIMVDGNSEALSNPDGHGRVKGPPWCAAGRAFWCEETEMWG